MDALLILNNKDVKNCRVLVKLTKKEFKNQVIDLLENDMGKEAFNILLKEADVRGYLPEDTPAPKIPMMITLHEDML
jgi:hypothetical protein